MSAEQTSSESFIAIKIDVRLQRLSGNMGKGTSASAFPPSARFSMLKPLQRARFSAPT